MPRKPEKDVLGYDCEFSLSEEKRCPICRQNSEPAEVAHVESVFSKNPQLENGNYL